MATALERGALREVLLSSGFELVEKTRDRGDGTHSETFQNGTNEKKCGDCGQQTGSVHGEGCFREGEWVGERLISHPLL